MKQKYYKCPSCGFATLYGEPSQQPQEWTPEYVATLLRQAEKRTDKLQDGCQVVADAHNAAIAAERQKQLLGSKHCPTTENELGDCSVAFIHIEHYFPKGYNPDDEPWKSIKAHHNAALAAEREKVLRLEAYSVELDKAEREVRKQLAAERETRLDETTHLSQQINKLEQQLAAEREKALAELEGFMKKQADDYDKDIEDCHRKLSAKVQELAAEREKLRELMDQLHTAHDRLSEKQP